MSHPTLREIPVFTFGRRSLVVVALCCVAEAQQSRRTFAITQSHYSVRAGERVEISSSADTVAFARSAKSLTARASGHMIRNFAVGPTPEGDKLLLGIPLTTEPGDYLVEVSLSGENEERSATLQRNFNQIVAWLSGE